MLLNIISCIPFLQLLQLVLGENRRGSTGSNSCVHFVSGGLAGITAASATYPLDLVRTRLAAQVNVGKRWMYVSVFLFFFLFLSFFSQRGARGGGENKN